MVRSRNRPGDFFDRRGRRTSDTSPGTFVTKLEQDLSVGRTVRHHEFVAYTSRSAGLDDCCVGLGNPKTITACPNSGRTQLGIPCCAMLNRHAASMRQEATNIRKYLLARQAYIPLIAVYAILGTAWAAFAHCIAPGIIVAAYADRSLSMLNRIFQGNRDLPVEHYLHSWNLVAGAIDIAVVLHFVIVLFIASIDRRHKLRFRDAAKTNANANIVLIAFSAVFLTTTAITGFSRGDYGAYDIEWTSILNGQNPWT